MGPAQDVRQGPTAAPSQRVQLISVLLLALVAHASGLGGDFTFDDLLAVVEHPVVRGDAPLVEAFTREWFGEPLGESWSSSYRPLTTLSYALVARLGGGALGQHIVNWLLYAALCAAVLHLGRRFVREPVAWFAALAFAVMPLHVENVAALVGRADVMAALCGMLALGAFERPDGAAPKAVHLLAGCLAFWAAMLCKESVALLPGLVIWRVMLRARRGEAERWHYLGALAIALAGIAYIVPRQLLLSVALPEGLFNGADNLLHDAGPVQRIWGGMAVWGHYLLIGIKSAPLCADHTWGDFALPTSATGEGAGAAWLGLGAFVLALGDGLRALRTGRGGLFALAGLSALLVGHFVIPLSVSLGERLALWPSAFVLWALGDLIASELERSGSTTRLARPLLAGFVLICLAWTARTSQRSYQWRDNLALFRSSQEACPAALHNRVNLALSAARAKLPEEAVWHYAVAAALRPQYPNTPRSAVFELEAEIGLTHEREFWATALPGLPLQLGVGEPARFWGQLAGLLHKQGHGQAAALASQLARDPSRPPTSGGRP